MIFGEPSRTTPTKAVKEALFLKQKGRCIYCGKKMSIGYFHVDHKTPVKRHGSESLSNKQLLCGPCNGRKAMMTDGEFRRMYNLTPARQVEGPPRREIPQNYFQQIKKERDKVKRVTQNTNVLRW